VLISTRPIFCIQFGSKRFFTAAAPRPRNLDFAQAAMTDTQHECVSLPSLALMFIIFGLVVAAVTAYGTFKCIIVSVRATALSQQMRHCTGSQTDLVYLEAHWDTLLEDQMMEVDRRGIANRKNGRRFTKQLITRRLVEDDLPFIEIRDSKRMEARQHRTMA